LAIEAAPAAIPENPNIAAIMAIIKNIADHFNIFIVLSFLIIKILRANLQERTAEIEYIRQALVFYSSIRINIG
jgi:hypothetical protein